jgi:hypothetical protein
MTESQRRQVTLVECDPVACLAAVARAVLLMMIDERHKGGFLLR